MSDLSIKFSIAPMMEWTDRHCRFFHRILTRHALLYTEMITTGAVLRGDRARLSRFRSGGAIRSPMQLCVRIAQALAESARICADLGYDEINLNVGCPSIACGWAFRRLPDAEPAFGRDCVAAMKAVGALFR